MAQANSLSAAAGWPHLLGLLILTLAAAGPAQAASRWYQDLIDADGTTESATNGDARRTAAARKRIERKNGAPSISGTAAAQAYAGTLYVFTPTATDPDDDALTFRIVNAPGWARLDAATGALSGIPAEAGFHAGIEISVSDGFAEASLAPFSIEVLADPVTQQPEPVVQEPEPVVQEPEPVAVNNPPTVAGVPNGSVLAGEAYQFQPVATDPDGDPLGFYLENAPGWVQFDDRSGMLSGSPSAADVGLYQNLIIIVSDGQANAGIGPFDIEVVAAASGSATLNWLPPDANADGTVPLDLAGFRVYKGLTVDGFEQVASLDNPGIATFVVTDLTPGDWLFAVTAFDSAGLESEFSNFAVKTIR
jgi:hypothetical protein